MKLYDNKKSEIDVDCIEDVFYNEDNLTIRFLPFPLPYSNTYFYSSALDCYNDYKLLLKYKKIQPAFEVKCECGSKTTFGNQSTFLHSRWCPIWRES